MQRTNSGILLASQNDLKFEIERRKKLDALVNGIIQFEVEDPNGKIRSRGKSFNALTTNGFNYLLNAAFRNGVETLYADWYIGLISNSSYSGLAVGDTLASHPGWTEDTTHYSSLTERPAWSPAAASAKSISNTSSTNFPISNDNTVIMGIFVCSTPTWGNTSDLLFSEGLFSSAQTLYNGDTLKITYVVNLN